jgi:hypothetical protein
MATEVEKLIGAINMEECYRRREIRGKDFNDWHGDLERWKAAGQDREILGLLTEIMDACETLEQYDEREPQPYWYEEAAKACRRLSDPTGELAVLQRWLVCWPLDRRRLDKVRERFLTRAERVRQLL